MGQVKRAIERAKAEILEDVFSGRIPSLVKTFADLHDYVDANEYGGLTEIEFTIEDANTVQSAVDVWIREGGHRE